MSEGWIYGLVVILYMTTNRTNILRATYPTNSDAFPEPLKALVCSCCTLPAIISPQAWPRCPSQSYHSDRHLSTIVQSCAIYDSTKSNFQMTSANARNSCWKQTQRRSGWETNSVLPSGYLT